MGWLRRAGHVVGLDPFDPIKCLFLYNPDSKMKVGKPRLRKQGEEAAGICTITGKQLQWTETFDNVSFSRPGPNQGYSTPVVEGDNVLVVWMYILSRLFC